MKFNRVISIFLLVIFFLGYFSELDFCVFSKKSNNTIVNTVLENSQDRDARDEAPFDDCGEGGPCSGHCHFGQCLSVLLPSIPVIPTIKIKIAEVFFKYLPSTFSEKARPFRPPIC